MLRLLPRFFPLPVAVCASLALVIVDSSGRSFEGRANPLPSAPPVAPHGHVDSRPPRTLRASSDTPAIAPVIETRRYASAITPFDGPAAQAVVTMPHAALPPDVQTAIPEIDAAGVPVAAVNLTGRALLEVQLGRIARRVLKAYWRGDDVLFPLAAWLDFTEVRHEAAGPAITGRLEPSGIGFSVNAATGSLRTGTQVRQARDGELAMVDGEVYASRGLISELLGLSTAVDPENATLIVYNPENLPIGRRLHRESARAIHVGEDRAVAPDLIHHGPERARAGIVAAYNVRSSTQNTEAATAYDLGLATGVARGSAVLWARGAGSGSPELEGAWSRAWPRSRRLTQLRVGDGPSSGPRPQNARGVWLTNAPIARPVLVEDMPFAGSLPPDWSLEAYRGGHLIGFDSVGSSGKYSLTLPIQYGENPVDFVAYGPFGEVRTFNRTFRALPSMLPPGVVEYGLTAGECRDPRCSATANIDLRYGATRRWALRSGLDQFWGPQGPLSHAYAGVVGTPINSIGVELEGVTRLLYRAGLRFEPSIGLRLTADYVAFTGSGSNSPFQAPGTLEQWSLYGRYAPGHRTGAVVFEVQGTQSRTTDGNRATARGGASLQASNMVLRPYVRAERLSSGAVTRRGYAGLDATILPRRSLGPVLGGLWLQAQIEAEVGRAVSSASAVLARNLGPSFRVEAGTRWDRALPGPMFTLSLVSQLQSMRATSVLTAPSGGVETRLDQSVGGSVVWSPNGGPPTFSSEPSLDRGGIGGRVFLDLNADGEWNEGEPTLPGTRLLVANRWVTSDAEGRYSVWGLPPYEESLVSIDTTSLSSPWYMPGYAAAAVVPTANLIQGSDVPVVIGGVVEGMLLMKGAASESPGSPLPVEMTELGSGTRTVVDCFTDGTFYRMGLRPGRYQATVQDAAARRSGLVSDTVRFTLNPSRSANDPGPAISGLRITLRPL